MLLRVVAAAAGGDVDCDAGSDGDCDSDCLKAKDTR